MIYRCYGLFVNVSSHAEYRHILSEISGLMVIPHRWKDLANFRRWQMALLRTPPFPFQDCQTFFAIPLQICFLIPTCEDTTMERGEVQRFACGCLWSWRYYSILFRFQCFYAVLCATILIYSRVGYAVTSRVSFQESCDHHGWSGRHGSKSLRSRSSMIQCPTTASLPTELPHPVPTDFYRDVQFHIQWMIDW